MGRDIEWPPGSGRVAFWEDHEIELMKGIAAQCERGEITKRELGNQMDVIHALKVEFPGAHLATEREARAVDVGALSKTTLPLPGRIRDQLRLGEVAEAPVDAPESAQERLPVEAPPSAPVERPETGGGGGAPF